MTQPDIVIFTDDPGWHGRELTREFAARGHRAVYVALGECHVDLAAGRAGLVIPGFAAALPRAAFVRGVPGGSLEAIVLRLNILHALDALGCVVFNSGRVIERTVDKAMTSLLLQQRGIRTPATFVSEDSAAAQAYVNTALAEGRRLVKKPLFGSQGRGLRRITAPGDLGPLLPGEVAYLQDFVSPQGSGYQDYRVMVVAGEAIAAMERRSEYWITNRAQGATCCALELSPTMAQTAVAAAAAVQADYAGVDLLRGPGGEWLVTEVNGIPAWAGLERATGVMIAALLCDALCVRLGRAVDTADTLSVGA